MKFWNFFYSTRLAAALFVLLTAACCFPSASRLTMDLSNQAILEQGKAWQDHETFLRVFGSDDTVAVALEARDIYQQVFLSWIERFCAFAEKSPRVSDVQSLTRMKSFQKDFFRLSEKRLTEDFLKGLESREELIAKVRGIHEITSQLVNDQGTMTLAAAVLKSDLSSPERSHAVREMREWIQRNPAPQGSRVFESGTAVEQDVFVRQIERDHHLFVPLTFAVILAGVVLAQRSLRAAFFPACVLGVTLLSTQALMVWTGHALNVVTTLVSPVILIVSVSNAVHIQSHIRHAGEHPDQSRHLQSLFRSLGMPCLLTTLTTVAGFYSLLTIRVPAVRQFGIYAGTGVFLSLVWTALLTPFFFRFHVRQGKHSVQNFAHDFWAHLADFLARFVLSFRALILAAAACLTIAGFFSAKNIRIETDILQSFPKNHPFRTSTEKIQQGLGGIYRLEMMLQAPAEKALKDPEILKKLIEFQKSAAQIPGVKRAHYVTDVISSLDRMIRDSEDMKHGKLPPDFYLKRYWTGLEESADPQLARIRTQGFKETRMTLDLEDSNTRRTVRIAEEVQALAQRNLPAGWKILTAGETYLLARMSQQLVRDLLSSSILSFGVVVLIMVLGMRPMIIGILSGVVNLIPMILAAGLMPLLDLSLSTATATIAGVAFGMVVDNAIHVLYQYHHGHFTDRAGMLHRIMHVCSPPLISSVLILCAGFAVTVFGSVRPTVHFGLLTALVLFLALVSNLCVLPALLKVKIMSKE